MDWSDMATYTRMKNLYPKKKKEYMINKTHTFAIHKKNNKIKHRKHE